MKSITTSPVRVNPTRLLPLPFCQIFSHINRALNRVLCSKGVRMQDTAYQLDRNPWMELHQWRVYILECADGSYYTGATNNMTERLRAHNEGKGSKYVRSRLPARLKYVSQPIQEKADALRLEARVKKAKKNRKRIVLTEDRFQMMPHRHR